MPENDLIEDIEAPKINDEVAMKVSSQVVDGEYETARKNQGPINDDFESYVDLLDSHRSEKEYDWMSDIRLPEFTSRHITQLALDSDLYFGQNEFVDVFLQDESDEAVANAAAAKELVNRTLTQRHINHYAKYNRGQSIKHLSGKVYARCWWEQEIKEFKEEQEVPKTDGLGNITIETKLVDVEEIVKDRFNYDIIDPRNVFYDNTYTYTLQEKDWVTIRSETTYEKLKQDEKRMGYINLDKVEGISNGTLSETETAKETYNNGEGENPKQTKTDKPILKYFDSIERFGTYYCKVTERNKDGEPIKVVPGIDNLGQKIEGGEYLDTIVTFALIGSSKILIRFQLNPFKDAHGDTFKPIIRGLCYIHPTSDGGYGDGKSAKELQRAVDDVFNLGMDNTMLATLPTLMVTKDSLEDNHEVYIQPGHNIPVENRDDISELNIQSDIGGVLNQIAMLKGSMDTSMAVYPQTQGAVGAASTTATAIIGSEQKADIRTNYKALTYEHTLLSEMYWMIQQMTYRFALPETAKELMGEKVFDFNPVKDYMYKPVSEAIESEQSKGAKIQKWTQILGYITQLQHPDAVNLLNQVLQNIFKLFGDEFVNYGQALLDPAQPLIPEGAEGGSEGVTNEETPVSNQNGIPQSETEQQLRGE